MSYTRKIAYNTIVQYIGKAITTAISLVLIAALTRYLGVAGYGQYTTVFAYVAFWAVLADFGFFWVLVREISKPEADVGKIANNILTLRTVLGIIVFLVGFLIALFLKYDLTIKLGIGVIGIAWLWTTLNSTLVGVFQSKLRMDKAVITEVVGRAIILGMVLLMIKYQMGLIGIFWAYVIGNLVNFLFSLLLASRYFKIKPQIDWDLWKKIAIMAYPIGITLILHLIYFRIDTVILSLMKGNIDVGIYGAPYKILEILLLLPALFMGAAFPVLTKYYVSKDKRLIPAFQKAFDFLIILAVPVVIGVSTLAKPIINFIAGEEFVNTSTISLGNYQATAVTALQILIFSVGIYFIFNLFYYLVLVMNRQKELIRPYFIVVIVNIILNLIFIPFYSYIAAAVVTIISSTLVLILTYLIVRRLLHTTPILGIIPKALFGALIMFLALYFLPQYNLFVLIAIGTAVYFITMYLIGAINKEMILAVIRKE